MPAKYSVKENRNPLNEQAASNRYVIAKSLGEVNLKSSGNEISKHCTVTSGNTSAISGALRRVMSEHLSEERNELVPAFYSLGKRTETEEEGADFKDKYRKYYFPLFLFSSGLCLLPFIFCLN
jgi:hypothetical protein